MAVRRSSSLLQHLELVCIIFPLHLLILSASATFNPPPLRYNIDSASLWHCYHDLDLSTLRQLLSPPSHQDSISEGAEVIHSRGNWVEIVSSHAHASVEYFASLGLDHCTRVGPMGDIIANELRENMDTLQYHVAEEGSLDHTLDDVQGGGKGRGDSEDATEHVQSITGELEAGRAAGGNDRVLRSQGEKGKVKSRGYEFDHYLNNSAIEAWYEDLAASHPSYVTLEPSIGKTHYDRDIFAVHLTEKSSLQGNTRPKIYIQCLIHPREWITGPVCMYISEQLVENSMFSHLLHEVEVVVVPIANPDGYFVTWYKYPTYRLWRKNVQSMQGSKCAGVDLNRNFDSHWSEDSSSQSDDPCDEVYRGPEASSELEVQAISSYLKSLGPPLIGVIDFHSFLQEVLYPPAWADAHPEGLDVIRSVAESVASTTSKGGVAYSAKRMFDVYSATGTFADWLLDLRESDNSCSSLVPLTIELRPSLHQVNSTSQGFLLPQSQIYPTCLEMLLGFIEFTELVLDTGKDCYVSQNRP